MVSPVYHTLYSKWYTFVKWEGGRFRKHLCIQFISYDLLGPVQNEFRSRMKLVLHSHDKIDRRHSRMRGFRARSKTNMAQVPRECYCVY